MRSPRKRIKPEVTEDNVYFSPPAVKEFVSTGCTKLDCDLGGGYVLGRVVNIVGDKSTAKTALATEAVINFLRAYPDGAAFYRETEAAFDVEYARSMGLPLDRVDFGDPDKPVVTVEDFARDLGAFVGKRLSSGTPGVYVLDSLDALSDEAEMDRDIGKGSYGTQKAAKMSELFRTVTRKLERTRVLLVVISQVRDKIGVMFGERHTRSGGRALDFYASQIIWLSKLGDLKRSIKKNERTYGVQVRAKIKKNKVGVPGRETDFEFHFGYGVEDMLTSLEWLHKVGHWDDLTEMNGKEYADMIGDMSDAEYRRETVRVGEVVKKVWLEIEDDFKPRRSKYET